MEKHSAEELSLEIPGLVLSARVWGPSNGLRVLGLHGWLDNAATFDRLAPLLSGVRLVAVDLPGHGLSQHRSLGCPYHFVDWITDVTAIANALNWETFSLLGHSMGAAIACLVAGTWPERVKALALLDGLGPLTVDPPAAPERLASGIAQLLATSDEDKRVYPTLSSAAARLRQASPGMSETAAEVLVARGVKEVSGGYCWRSDPRLRIPSLFRFTEAHVHAFLDRINCPTLIVRASAGYPFEQAWAIRQLERLRNLHLVEVSGGHHVHLDTPEQVVPPLQAFFDSLSAENPR